MCGINNISMVEAIKIINSTNGRIFAAEFVKKDNSIRSMNCRLGVKKGVSGIGMGYDPSALGLKPVYDMRAKGWRMLNLKTITRLRFSGKEFLIIKN